MAKFLHEALHQSSTPVQKTVFSSKVRFYGSALSSLQSSLGCLVKILVIICFIYIAHSLPLNQCHCPYKLHLQHIFQSRANLHELEKLEPAILFCWIM